MKFIHFQNAEFMMGAGDQDPGDLEDYEKPKHKVSLSPFAVSSTCVTMREWHEFLRQARYQWDFGEQASQRSPTDDHPAVFVSWFDALAFCDWKSRDLGDTVRLPTEAEWEFVCQQVSMERVESQNTFRVWCERFQDVNPVAAFSSLPQEAGIFGVWEGVAEWCIDSFEEDAYVKLPGTDPMMRGPSPFRVVRGGSPLASGYPRCSYRGFLRGNDRTPVLGFRTVISRVNNGTRGE